LISKKAFDAIEFVDSEPVDRQIYYTKRVARDKRAREEYYASADAHAEYEEYINDIMRKGDTHAD
ncbi:MAG: DUF3990 domain-containing protein, partial [Clostridia bacterium]|nr:DUF3990 domain-containing protein [Clostridia bacterium]